MTAIYEGKHTIINDDGDDLLSSFILQQQQHDIKGLFTNTINIYCCTLSLINFITELNISSHY